jgi:release factor glutamine methyltransferase
MADSWTIRDVLAWTAGHLAERGSDTARLDADVLLAHALGTDRLHLYLDPDRPLSAAERDAYRELVRARAGGAPVAHLTGEREFWSLPFRITPDVLIPRPDTEVLVEQALTRMEADTGRAADLGTGSGCIAAALVHDRPGWRLDATEVDPAAAAVARDNLQRLDLAQRVTVYEGEWLAPLAHAQYDVIVSNPPYVRADDPHLGVGDVAAEPRAALVAEEQGLAAHRAILAQAPAQLAPGGWLLLEIGLDQGETVAAAFTEAGFEAVTLSEDYGGRPRVVMGQWPG